VKKMAIIVVAVLLFPSISFSHISPQTYAQKRHSKYFILQELKKVVSTGYYTPVPRQMKYVENYWKDRRRNGPGIDVRYSRGGVKRPPVEGRTIAVNPNIIKPGTVIHIPGLGARIAEDGGDGVQGIDIYFGKGDAGRIKAMAWEKRVIVVTILGKAKI